MPQQVKFGNLLKEVTAGVIIHGCNDQGVMGSGFAKELRETYPKAYEAYALAHKDRPLQLGENILVCEYEHLMIVNAITQSGFGRDGKRYVSYKAIYNCFKKLSETISPYSTLHYPLIGAGLGGGEWAIIQACIDAAVDPRINRNLWILD